jgi:hypothetical protein
MHVPYTVSKQRLELFFQNKNWMWYP